MWGCNCTFSTKYFFQVLNTTTLFLPTHYIYHTRLLFHAQPLKPISPELKNIVQSLDKYHINTHFLALWFPNIPAKVCVCVKLSTSQLSNAWNFSSQKSLPHSKPWIHIWETPILPFFIFFSCWLIDHEQNITHNLILLGSVHKLWDCILEFEFWLWSLTWVGLSHSKMMENGGKQTFEVSNDTLQQGGSKSFDDDGRLKRTGNQLASKIQVLNFTTISLHV